MSKARKTRTKRPAGKGKRGLPGQKTGTKSSPKAPPASKFKLKQTPKSTPQVSQTGLSVPFHPTNRILLVGEGDFSFSNSLLHTHSCAKLTATTLESSSKLLEKYPQATMHVACLEATNTSRVLYGIDATALGHPIRGGGSNFRKLGPWDRVVFNFPHRGGLTRDVNRQVRANQELCVKFLEKASSREVLAPGGRVVVTLFEGEPYELWGIRNLARSVGLVVVRSARFEWERYPGYRHVRTLGNLRRESGWKAEERRARMYIFGRPGEEELNEVANGGCKKRKRSDNNSSDDDEDSNETAAAAETIHGNHEVQLDNGGDVDAYE